MENLEQQEKVKNLGRLFVKELKLEPGVDTFSRWMAHYIAEKMTVAEQARSDEDKKVAEKECFDVILKLWEHRQSLPDGRRPFQNFEPILDTLSQLNPDTEEPYFYNALHDQDIAELETDNLDNKSVEEWVNIANDIDKTARIWIEYALEQTINEAKNERTEEWIKNTIDLSDNADVEIISVLLNQHTSFDIDSGMDNFSNRYDIERLKKRISQLKKYTQLNEALLKAYEADLDYLLNKK
ncbi:hypothetical protein [Sphingobacterium chungjuense]|uniref:hypothetical protein n=1 Tax=Sphingobacterium chungjuense TaxID=2675553 RepID=UPI00140A33A9|nr:hypothetical protein [Sphingobacterium chungjuense]